MNSTELHLHTHYSLLDGLNTPTEYFERASELGMTHLAITDHGTLSGHRDFQKAAQASGITPILGCEMYISATDRFDRRAVKKRDDNTQAYNHITVLAKNAQGLVNLNKLSRIAWTEGFYSKPRIDMEVLEENADGLIVLSGCLNGLISKAITNEMPHSAKMLTSEFKRIFDDRFFIEIQGHNPEELNHALLDLCWTNDVKPVVTSDCHYARKEDLWIEDAMLILSTNPKPNYDADMSKAQKMDFMERFNYLYPDRQMTFQEYEIYLRSAQEHTALLAKQGIGDEAVRNTMIVAEMVEDYPFHENLDLLPRPEGDSKKILRDMVEAGLKEKGLWDNPVYMDRAFKEELPVINDKGFEPYFINVADAIQWGRGQGIRFGPGRGSGAGSLVNYVLGITDVDPIPHNLLFFRFLNPDRNDWPDVDIDVEVKRRSEVKNRLLQVHKHVASIATFGKFQGKNSIKDAARVFRIPLKEVNKALMGADWPSAMPFFELWEATPNGKEFKVKYPEVVKLAKMLHGRIKLQGMHPGGLVMSKEPIENYAPIQTAKDHSDEAGARIPLVAYDMDEVAEIGLIKMDWLGVSMLTVIEDAMQLIRSRHGDVELPDFDNVDDPKIYENLSNGFTRGVFQCDQNAYTNLLVKMGVNSFSELVATNALVRPGAANSTAGASFIARLKGQEAVTYHHDKTKPFTEDTYGVIIYQEQVMLAMTELAGMEMKEADKVRKIIGKKRDVKEFEEYKKRFVDGASRYVIKSVAEKLWHDFEAHAGYSFNKSHAVSYSLISYWTAWLKEYYPLEYMTSLLRNEGDKDKVLDFLMEAKRLGIQILLPHVNYSGIDFEIESKDGQDYIRMGLSNIKWISGKIAAKLIALRPFENYQDLLEQAGTKGSGISTRVVASLNAIGAAEFPGHPLTGNERDNFYEYLNIPSFQSADMSPRIKTQIRPLEYFTEDETFVASGMVRGIKRGPGWARLDLVDESGSASVFADEHTPIETGQIYVFLISNNSVARYVTVDELADERGGDFQEFLERSSLPDVPEGMLKVISFRTRKTKKGQHMADVVFADADKQMAGALLFPGMFQKGYSKLQPGKVVEVDLNSAKGGGLFVENVH